ncbi:MAG: hypothetical protein PW786_08625 [Arachidicoccus sp.]|nr:hypothetical protein [Arachidicoccus sp.]
MLEELENLVKEATGSAVFNASDVSNDQADAIAQHAHSSILSELQSAVSGGGIGSIIGMLGGGNAANSGIGQNILGSLTSSLSQKFGLNPAIASSLSSSIVPSVLSKLSGQFSDPNNSNVTEQSVASALGGGGLLDKLKSLL